MRIDSLLNTGHLVGKIFRQKLYLGYCSVEDSSASVLSQARFSLSPTLCARVSSENGFDRNALPHSCS